MRFHVLGPLRVEAAGEMLRLRPGMPRRVLAALLLRARSPVMTSELIDALWPDGPPVHAVKVVQTYIHRLRTDLGSGHGIVRDSGGYRIDAHPSDVDSEVFVAEIEQARLARDVGDLDRAYGLLDRALRRWRGRPFGDLGAERVFEPEAARLEQWHAAALQDRGELHLLAGRPEQAVLALSELLTQHPHKDRTVTQLMVALVRSGRRADALDVYTRHRIGLAEEFGLEPGAELKRLHIDILRDQVPPAVAGDIPVPRQLPPDVYGFTGRQRQMRQLDQLIAPPPDGAAVSAIFSVVGAAGIGKTTLAVHWAHERAHHFPDGQLYIDLHGYDPGGQPTDSATAVRGFLDALGVRHDRMPQSLGAQEALLRSRIAGRRMLLVLDNVHDVQQVRPLLPGYPHSKVLVTSRHQLLGLGAAHGAHVITLEQLSETDAKQLLSARLGAERVHAEPAATSEIIKHCGGLPLALAIIAARAASRPQDPLAQIARKIHEAPGPLDPFQTADAGTDLRAVFSWSQRWLSPGARTLFRLLGVHPGPEISRAAAGRLAGVPDVEATELLTELADAHLISETASGRYALHDLVHAYATEQACHFEPENLTRAAKRRLIDHYLLCADAADRLINVNHRMPALSDVHSASTVPFDDETGAIQWLTTERTCLLATLRAAASECDRSAWRLGLAIAHYLFRHGYWTEHLATSFTALAAARNAGDTNATVLTLINTGRAYIQLCQHDFAEGHLREAIRLAQSSQDTIGYAGSILVLSWVLDLQGKHEDAVAHAEQAVGLFRSAGDPAGQARALNTLGWFHSRLGDPRRALELCLPALRLLKELGDREAQAATWHSLGYAHCQLGDQRQALRCYDHALRLYDDLRIPYFTGSTLASIGDAHQATGARDAAVDAWRKAQIILEEIDHPDAEIVRTKLASTCESASDRQSEDRAGEDHIAVKP